MPSKKSNFSLLFATSSTASRKIGGVLCNVASLQQTKFFWDYCSAKYKEKCALLIVVMSKQKF